MLNLLAFDLGASNGRAILGQLDGDKLICSELHRFENYYIEMNGVMVWDVPYLFTQMKEGFRAFNRENVGELNCFGIDTWGVDYGLLDRNGHLLSNPRSYRMAVPQDAARVFEVVDEGTIFRRTGISTLDFNTVFQLYRRKAEGDIALENAESMLMIPDLLAYFFTGEIKSEYTNSTTTMLFNPISKDWDRDIIEKLKLPQRIFKEIDYPGTVRGKLLPALAKELDMKQIPYAVVGTHDTASAVAATPGTGNFAFCSSGTWSILGTETEAPALSEAVHSANYSNEGSVQGTFRPNKNIVGLWLIQECRRDWGKMGINLSWDDVVYEAKKAEPFRTVIDTDDSAFFVGCDMVEKIRNYCRKTGLAVPETVGQVARCIYESLALKYRYAMEQLEQIKGERIMQLNIVGGGIQNKMLNQLIADSIDRKVVTGPVEGAAVGNILMQAVALGRVKNVEHLRSIVSMNEKVEEYLPNHSAAWDKAYYRLREVMEGKHVS